MKILLSLGLLLGCFTANAAEVYVEDTILQSGANQDDANTAYELVRNSVPTVGRDTLTDDLASADFVLQPRLMKLGESYVLTVERRRGDEIVYASQVKATSLADLDRAARRATQAALSGPASSTASRSAATTGTVDAGTVVDVDVTNVEDDAQKIDYRLAREGYQLTPGARPHGYWSIGLGPFAGRNLETDDVFYNFNIGRNWDIDPRVSVKLLGEANFATGEESASFINFGGGASWFFTADKNGAAYLTGDLGYGFASSAEDEEVDNFSFGAGIGYQFFRTRTTTLDIQLRYASILEEMEGEDGFPRMLGARLAVNF